VISDSQAREFLDFAGLLADAAGAVITPFFRTAMAVDNKAGGQAYDPVTLADKSAEQAIRALIENRYPDHGIIGEELGIKESACGLSWVLDPIDGTRSFIMGLPTWGTLIALTEDGIPRIGMMDQPYIGERFVGSAAGAEMAFRGQTKPLRTRACPKLAGAVVATTHPSMFTARQMRGFQAVSDTARLSRFGGDCYLYAMIASGCIDLAIEASLKPYDIQALIPIVEGAGGRVCNWQGGPVDDSGTVLAAGDPGLLDEVIGIIANA